MEIDNNEIVTNIATNLIEDTIKVAWNKTQKLFKDMDATLSLKYGNAYTNYLNNTYTKYSRIKTIIYRHIPQYLYDFYECVGVKCGTKIIDTKSINNLINVNNEIIITGTGGIGKSILFKHLFLNTIIQTDLIPVLIELRSFNLNGDKSISLSDTIYEYLVNNGFILEKEYFEKSMSKGGYVILLDGFDEVNRNNSAKVSKAIKDLCNHYRKNHYIVSSRPLDEFIGWNEFVEMSALPFTKEQALNLVKKIDFDEKTKEIFYKELDDNLYDKYKSFASNPLLLNIMLLTFDNHAYIPDKLNDFYEQAFATLFNMHDATKDSYVRDIRTKLGCEDFKTVFAYICFKSYFRGQFEFSESLLRKYIQQAKDKFTNLNFSIDDFQDDLVLSVCMLVKEGINYRFSHRSFQEYFAAWYTCKLTDDIQTRLLTNWIKESDSMFFDAYFTMLFNMQGEKVNKIIFSSGLKEIKKLYNQDGFSFKFLQKLFTSVRFKVSKNKKYKISLVIKDNYLCGVLMLSLRLNGYSFPKMNDGKEEKLINILIEKEKLKGSYKSFDFNELVELVPEQVLLDSLEWFKVQLEFLFELLKKIEGNSARNKRKVSTILDEL